MTTKEAVVTTCSSVDQCGCMGSKGVCTVGQYLVHRLQIGQQSLERVESMMRPIEIATPNCEH